MLRFMVLVAFGVMSMLTPAWADGKIKVVASFSILEDMVRNVGGDRVSVSALVGSDGDAHMFTPSPADVQKVSTAQVLVVNGLGFEGWMDRLVQASGFTGERIAATIGVNAIKSQEDGHGHDHIAFDPHAWQSVKNARLYVINIRDGLIKADPDGAEIYKANARAYMNKLDELDVHVREVVSRLAQDKRKVVTSHDAFAYFGAEYGLRFIGARGLSDDAEPSAQGVAQLIRQIRDEKVRTLFIENRASPKLLNQIARETGVKVGGKLYADVLSPADGPAPSYIQMMQYNIRTLYDGLKE